MQIKAFQVLLHRPWTYFKDAGLQKGLWESSPTLEEPIYSYFFFFLKIHYARKKMQTERMHGLSFFFPTKYSALCSEIILIIFHSKQHG